MDIKLIPGHCYRLRGEYDHWNGDKALPFVEDFIGIYIGREEGFQCMICGKGENAYCFNVFQGDDTNHNPTRKEVEDYIDSIGYETFAFGKEHLPKVLEEIL